MDSMNPSAIDVDLDNVVQADIATVKEMADKFPELFGADKPYRLVYGVPYRNVSSSDYTGPRRVSEETRNTVVGKYFDPALALRPSEIDNNILKTKLKLEHNGQQLDGRFLGYKIVNGRVHALMILRADTPEKRAIADNIGPDKQYNGFSVAPIWAANKDKSAVLGPAQMDHVAITDKPFYDTFIYMAASKDAVQADIAYAEVGMR